MDTVDSLLKAVYENREDNLVRNAFCDAVEEGYDASKWQKQLAKFMRSQILDAENPCIKCSGLGLDASFGVVTAISRDDIFSDKTSDLLDAVKGIKGNGKCACGAYDRRDFQAQWLSENFNQFGLGRFYRTWEQTGPTTFQPKYRSYADRNGVENLNVQLKFEYGMPSTLMIDRRERIDDRKNLKELIQTQPIRRIKTNGNLRPYEYRGMWGWAYHIEYRYQTEWTCVLNRAVWSWLPDAIEVRPFPIAVPQYDTHGRERSRIALYRTRPEAVKALQTAEELSVRAVLQKLPIEAVEPLGSFQEESSEELWARAQGQPLLPKIIRGIR